MLGAELFDFHTMQGLERRRLPVLVEQKDIRYFGTYAKSVLNDTDVTGRPFLSINPYTCTRRPAVGKGEARS